MRFPFDLGALAAWALPALLLVYLGLNNGGYDLTQRSEVGIAIWWVILVGALAATISFPRRGSAVRISAGLLLAFATWTALSLNWTSSDERSAIELGKIATLLGVFILTVSEQGAQRWRAALGGVTTAVVVLVVLAALSRMVPDSFPAQDAADFFPGLELERRLAYPLNYSTGLATLSAIGLPLLLAAAAGARLILVRALAAGAIPLFAMVLWLSGSSLAIPLTAVGLITYLLLTRDRGLQLLTAIVAGAGSAILVIATAQREAIDQGLGGSAQIAEGKELLAIAAGVIVGITLIQVAISLFERHAERRAPIALSGTQLALGGIATLLVAGACFVAVGGIGKLDQAWDDFRSPTTGIAPNEETRSAQIFDVSSNGRYQFWGEARQAFESEPLTGIGPGTFEFYWTENRDSTLFVRDAHSLWFETAAELGLPGLVLLLGFFAFSIFAICRRALAFTGEARPAVAAAAAGAMAFAAAASIDWVWELGVLAIVFAALLGIGLRAGEAVDQAPVRALSPWQVGLALLCVIGLAAVAIPLGGSEAVERSQAAAGDGEIPGALDAANDGVALQPYAASPALQRALVLEESGNFEAAALAARDAAEEEPSNWRNWATLSRLEARAGDAQASLEAYERAKELNPQSEFFIR